MIENLNKLIGKKVKRLFLVIWPPFGEEHINQIDISIGIVFEDKSDELYVITTDKNDLTIPDLYFQSVPDKYFDWKEFYPRMERWMNCEEGMEIDMEYYEVSDISVFQNIVHNTVIDVELVEVSGSKEPIGIKILFEKDYILSTPIVDGNTIETSLFNRNNNLKHFLPLGSIEYRSVKDHIPLDR